MLVDYLPPESAFQTEVRNSITPEITATVADTADPAEAPWSVSEMLAATIVDELRYLRHTLVQVNSERDIGPPPDPMPRPGVRRKPKRKRLTADQRAALDPRLAVVPDGDNDA